MANRNEDPRSAEPRPPFAKQVQEAPGRERRLEPTADSGEHSYVGHGRLEDRVALVTGADSGIGRAVAIAFAREGAHVMIGFLSEHEDAQETKRLVEASGRRAATLAGDLADEQHCARLVRETVDRFGKLDIVVNNAAFQGKAAGRFEDLDPARVERTFRVNILSMFHVVRHALPHLRPGGAIINTASIQAYQPNPQILDYAATKGAIVTFTKGLAKELAGRGIRVNAVAPGPVWTPLVAQSFPPEKNERFGAKTPLGRAAQPAELAPAYVFLACDDASFITGEILGITGGETLA